MTNSRIQVDPGRSALLLVDIQPDFFPGGGLGVERGDEILQPIQALIHSGPFDLLVATQDWHPESHVSFAANHDGKAPMDRIQLHGHSQVLWPRHCVQGTEGAALHPGLDWRPVSAVVRKGMDPLSDSYSGFRNNWDAEGERPTTGLAGYLRERGVQDVFVAGLARDYCVKWTAEDAVSEGFNAFFLWDLTRAVVPADDDRVRAELTEAGVRVVDVTAELDLSPRTPGSARPPV